MMDDLELELRRLAAEMRKTAEGRKEFYRIVDTLAYMKYRAGHGTPITYEQAKELIENDK